MKKVYRVLLGMMLLVFLNLANAENNFEYNPDKVYISKEQIIDNILKDINLSETEYKIAYTYLKNGSLSRKNRWDLPFENQQALRKLFGLKENNYLSIMQIDVAEILLNNWNYQNFENLAKIVRATNLSNEKYIQALAIYEKGDYSNLSNYAWQLRSAEKSDFELQKEIAKILIENWNEKDYEALVHTMNCANFDNKNFIKEMIIEQKGDYTKLSSFVCENIFDEEITPLAKEVYLKADELNRGGLYENKISSFNKYATWRKDFDPNYDLKESDIIFIKKYNVIDENKKYEIVKNVLASNKDNKFDEIFNQFLKQYKKEYYEENKEQILKNRFVNSPKYGLECFLHPSKHIDNFVARKRDNTAFAIGLLNPINTVSTIALLPIYVLVFMPLNGLP